MSKMKELYEKVAKDSDLLTKFNEIMDGARDADGDVTKQKLVAFAKDSGYYVTLDEIRDFFKEMAESKDRALSEAELDMVAGGKGNNNFTRLGGEIGDQTNKWITDPGGMLKYMF